jgi:uncharacterized protein (DUF736 family)
LFKGQIKTLSIRAKVEIISNRSKASETQPDYKVQAAGSMSVPTGSAPEELRAGTMCR